MSAGEVVIKTKVDNTELEKGMEKATDIADIHAKQMEQMQEENAEAQKRIEEIQKRIEEANKRTEEAEKGIAKAKAETEQYNQDIIQSELERLQLEEQQAKNKQREEEAKGIRTEIENIGKSLKRVTKSAVRWGLAIFGIRGIFGFIRNSMSVISQYDTQMATDIQYMKNALAFSLEPVVRAIVNLMKQLLYLIGSIIKFLFGINIFKNAEKGLKGATSGAKALNKELSKTNANFDEMNVLQDNSSSGGGGGGVSAPSFDLSNLTDLKIPAWIQWIGELFVSLWENIIKPTLEIIKIAWEEFSAILLEIWNEYGQPLIDNISEFVSKIIELFRKIWDDVLEPIITPFLEQLSWLWDEHIKGMIQSVGEFIMKLINGALEIYNKFIHPIVSWLLDFLSPVWAWFSATIIGQLGTVVAFISDMFSSIMKIFGGIIDFITGVFTGNWKKAWKGVVSIFEGLISGIVGIFKLPLNFIIDGINGFIAGLNKIKIPDWVPGVGGKGFHIAKIPKLASGGIINMPGRGVPVGNAIAGERGHEAVLPLTDSQQMALLGEAIGKYININATVPVYVGNRQIAREIRKINAENDFAYNG